MEPRPVNVLLLYHHARQQAEAERFRVHLKPKERRGKIKLFDQYDKAHAGRNVKELLDENLRQADVVMLLLCAQFYADDELYEALRLAHGKDIRLLPVLIGTVDIEEDELLGKILRPGTPVMVAANDHDAFVFDRLRELDALIKELQDTPPEEIKPRTIGGRKPLDPNAELNARRIDRADPVDLYLMHADDAIGRRVPNPICLVAAERREEPNSLVARLLLEMSVFYPEEIRAIDPLGVRPLPVRLLGTENLDVLKFKLRRALAEVTQIAQARNLKDLAQLADAHPRYKNWTLVPLPIAISLEFARWRPEYAALTRWFLDEFLHLDVPSPGTNGRTFLGFLLYVSEEPERHTLDAELSPLADGRANVVVLPRLGLVSLTDLKTWCNLHKPEYKEAEALLLEVLGKLAARSGRSENWDMCDVEPLLLEMHEALQNQQYNI